MAEFVVTAPPDTPPDAALFLAGDGDALGNWESAGVLLDRWGDGTYRTRLDLPAGRARFLVTRGHWRSAETDGHGRERSPRETAGGGPFTVEAHVAGWGRDAVRYHPDFPSEYLPHARPVSVHLPPGYDLDPAARFPVFYLHDGQNLFDAHTAFGGVPWACDESAERTARAGSCEPVILVGVGNSPDRLREYGPRADDHPDDLSAAYSRFLTDEVKPFVDRTYRTRPGRSDTAVCGSSMGGLISLHLAVRRPDVFGKCAAVSPSLWWDGESFLRAVGRTWTGAERVWLDMGGREGHTLGAARANVRRARRLAVQLRRLERDGGLQFHYHEDPDGGHNEAVWGRRFGPILRYLFPAGGPSD